MIPSPESALRMLAQRVVTTLLPGLEAAYVRSDGGMTAMLLGYLAMEMESGVSRRMTDISEMKRIFAEASARGLISVSVTEAVPADLTLHGVNACHAELTAALIDLHALLESDPCPAPDILALIWHYLEMHSKRHQLD